MTTDTLPATTTVTAIRPTTTDQRQPLDRTVIDENDIHRDRKQDALPVAAKATTASAAATLTVLALTDWTTAGYALAALTALLVVATTALWQAVYREGRKWTLTTDSHTP